MITVTADDDSLVAALAGLARSACRRRSTPPSWSSTGRAPPDEVLPIGWDPFAVDAADGPLDQGGGDDLAFLETDDAHPDEQVVADVAFVIFPDAGLRPGGRLA